jgi:hypothetical protein
MSPKDENGTFKPKKFKTKLAEQAWDCAEQLISGTVLAVDPSSGSAGSMPGYAIFEASKLIEAGTVEIDFKGRKPFERMQQLQECFSNDFNTPDVLCIELIAPYIMNKGKGAGIGQSKAAILLHRSIGCIMGSIHSEHCVEVSPQSWRKYIDKETYNKNDHNDAILIGYAAIAEAHQLKGLDIPKLELEDTEDLTDE